eukprot:10775833-Karenia_brevis.AAC.1
MPRQRRRPSPNPRLLRMSLQTQMLQLNCRLMIPLRIHPTMICLNGLMTTLLPMKSRAPTTVGGFVTKINN